MSMLIVMSILKHRGAYFKYITYGNIFDFDVDSNGNMINHSYTLPYNYAAIEENHRHGIRIGYIQQERRILFNLDGLYVSKIEKLIKLH